MRAKFIYEKFIENSDPIYDMGIGLNAYKKDIEHLQLTRILQGMNEDWKEIVAKAFGILINNIYFLGVYEKGIKNDHVKELDSKIKSGKKIFEKKFNTGGRGGDEIVNFKLYKTSAGIIGSFRYSYTLEEKELDKTVQYMGDISAAFNLDIIDKQRFGLIKIW